MFIDKFQIDIDLDKWKQMYTFKKYKYISSNFIDISIYIILLVNEVRYNTILLFTIYYNNIFF